MLFLQISRIFIISVVHMPSVGSSLLLRISPHTFAFIPISSMSLSSLNRSNCKAFRHIMPYSAPLCKALHYSKTGVPWQMNRIFIIVFSFLDLLRNAEFQPDFKAFPVGYIFLQKFCHLAKYSIFLQVMTTC